MSFLNRQIKNLPHHPGVYVFRNKAGNILYIGKAASLKSRVRSYFITDANQRINTNPRIINRPIEMMIHEVSDIEIKETDSVLEALILESHLIKKHQPKYNVIGKDDKSFSYFAITKEEFPRVLIIRKTDLNTKYPATAGPRQGGGHTPYTSLYGPYASKKQMEIALKIIRRIFPFHSLNQKTEKGCLDYQIGLCPGPYAEAISRQDYQKNIAGIKMILNGKMKRLVKNLEKEMKAFAAKHEFEKAVELRNKVFALKHIQDVALISKEEGLQVTGFGLQDLRIEAYDISNISGQYAVGSMIVFSGQEPDKSQYRKFRIKKFEGIDDIRAMKEILVRRFNNNWPKPDLMILDGGIGHLNMARRLLKTMKINVPMIAVAKGTDRKKLEVVGKNYLEGKDLLKIVENKLLIKKITDEAHRFAISYHRKLRKNWLNEKANIR